MTTTTPQVQFRTVDGVGIRYADSGGSQGPAVVLTSPWPESVYAFAPIWARGAGAEGWHGGLAQAPGQGQQLLPGLEHGAVGDLGDDQDIRHDDRLPR